MHDVIPAWPNHLQGMFPEVDTRGRRNKEVSIDAGHGVTITAQELEKSFGDGWGKWQLYVEGSGPLEVMSLLSSDSGHLTNVSW